MKALHVKFTLLQKHNQTTNTILDSVYLNVSPPRYYCVIHYKTQERLLIYDLLNEAT